jgi:hypothetical protein
MMDWAQAAVDLAAVRDDNAQSIVIRRGAATLPAQTVRIAGKRAGREIQGTGTRASVGGVVVLGSTDFDVQPGDRFTDAQGVLYEVTFVRPNRRAAVVADAESIE